MRAIFLADKSALARLPQPAVDRRLTPLLLAGQVARCGVVELELLYSARTHSDFLEILAARRALPMVATEQADFDRAIAVMGLLARQGRHRGPSIPNLLIAAVAERSGLTVLHYDRDFELISSVTGQSVEWIVPAGSVP